MVKNYERFITACGFLTIFVNIGMVTTGFGVHVPYMVEMPGMSLQSNGFLIRSITFWPDASICVHYFRLLAAAWLALACGTTQSASDHGALRTVLLYTRGNAFWAWCYGVRWYRRADCQ